MKIKDDVNDRRVTGTEKDIITDTKILATKCKECHFLELEILKNQQIIADMLATAEANRFNCIGLAANQIGEHKRIICFLPGGDPSNPASQFFVMVNPKIIPLRTHGQRSYKEACLSFPETIKNPSARFNVRRYKKVKIFFQNVYGGKDQRILTGIDAVIAQHEIDHLNGVLR